MWGRPRRNRDCLPGKGAALTLGFPTLEIGRLRQRPTTPRIVCGRAKILAIANVAPRLLRRGIG